MKSTMTVVLAAASSLTLLVMLLAATSVGVAVAAPPVPDAPAAATITGTQAAPLDLFSNVATTTPLPRLPEATTKRAVVKQLSPQALAVLATEPITPDLLLQVALFPDASYIVQFEHVVHNASGSVSWLGRLQGDDLSQVVLTTRAGMVYGTIYSPSGVFEMTQITGNQYLIREIDQSGFGENPNDAVPVPAASISTLNEQPAAPQIDDGSVVDVIVAYTDDARVAAGSTAAIETQIDTAINAANLTYQASGVASRVRLAAMFEVNYVESLSSTIDLNNLTQNLAGLQLMLNWRNAYAADIVTLITEQLDPATCGLAWHMATVSNAFAAQAYNVVARGCMNTNLSLPHEWGHNRGLRHDWYVETGTTPYSYAHGYVLTPTLPAPWRTIMAYNNRCTAAGTNCTRIGRWSNPAQFNGINRLGVPAGTSTACTINNLSNPLCDADDALALNNTAVTVANFRAGNLTNVYVNTVCTLVGGVCAETGTSGFPYDTFTEGAFRAAANTNVFINPGTYPETLVLVNQWPHRLLIDRPMTLQVNGSGTVVIGQ